MDGRWNRTRPDMPQRLRRWMGVAGERTRSTQVVGLSVSVVAGVLVVAIAIAALASAGQENQAPVNTAGGASGIGLESSTTPSTAPSTAPPTVPSPSPSKTKKPTTAPPTEDERTEEKPDPEPTTKKPAGTVSTPPTDFDAWRTGEGKYAANWEWPVSDGGLRISAYVLRKCDGTLLLRLNDATYAVEFNYPLLDCVTVQAVNAAGEGQKAYTNIPNP